MELLDILGSLAGFVLVFVVNARWLYGDQHTFRKTRSNALIIAGRSAIFVALVHTAALLAGINPLWVYGAALLACLTELGRGVAGLFLDGCRGWPEMMPVVHQESGGLLTPRRTQRAHRPLTDGAPLENELKAPDRPPGPYAGHVGQRGVAVTRLAPSGRVRIGEERLPAKSEYFVIDPGRPVRVLREESFGVIVEEVGPEEAG